jgi:hypothetical protein
MLIKKYKYMVMSQDRNVGRSHSIKNASKSFERMEELRYLESILTNQNSIQKETKSRFKSKECLLSFCAESLVF